METEFEIKPFVIVKKDYYENGKDYKKNHEEGVITVENDYISIFQSNYEDQEVCINIDQLPDLIKFLEEVKIKLDFDKALNNP